MLGTERQPRRSSTRLVWLAVDGLVLAAAALVILSGLPRPLSLGGAISAGDTQYPLPSDKAAREQYYASLAVAASLGPSRNPDSTELLSLPPQGTPFSPYHQTAAGDGHIVDSDLGPPGTVDATYSNDWYETTSSEVVEVYAGALSSDPTQGFVLVVRWDLDHASILASNHVSSPTKAGALTIVGATGEVLALRAADGSSINFDVDSGQFQ